MSRPHDFDESYSKSHPGVSPRVFRESRLSRIGRERRSGQDRRSEFERRQKTEAWEGVEQRSGEDWRTGWERRRSNQRRIPIFIKMASISTGLILLTIAIISLVTLQREKTQFEEQLIGFGRSLTGILATNAPDKLLGDEDLALFKLIEDVTENEQVVFAMITDDQKIVRAHSDMERVDERYSPPRGLSFLRDFNGTILSQFRLDRKDVFLFESPLTYRRVEVGHVRLALSKEQIQESILQAKVFFILLAVLIVGLGLVLSLAFSLYFSRPINELREGVVAVGMGVFDHRVRVNRQDELGELGRAINRMAEDLSLKNKITDSFGRYVTPEIVDLILAHPDRRWMRGARVNVSVLFVDIRGFMTMSEGKDPAWIVDLLNDYFSRVTDVVIAHGGHVNKFVGDEAMAIFGAPVANPDHADSAIKAALEIQRAVRHIEGRGGRGRVKVHVGVGVSSGDVVAGNVGSEKRMEYTVIGDDVNVASRLTSMARSGEILISKQTYELLDKSNGIRVEERGSLKVKGRRMNLSVYNVVT